MDSPYRTGRGGAGLARTRAARREGALAMVDHLLRGAAAPVNPYRPETKSALFFQWGAERARQFALPLREAKP